MLNKLSAIIKNILFLSLIPMLTACNGFFDKDNLPSPKPLVEFKPEIKPKLLWSINIHAGENGEYLKYTPTMSASVIYTASAKGIVTALNRFTGQQIWQIDTRLPLLTGVGYGQNLVIVVSNKGIVHALAAENGQLRWKTTVPGEVMANPVLQHNIVLIKTINGALIALSAQNGKQKWIFKQIEPNLILRGASQPIIQDNNVIVGFANGNLVKLDLEDGQMSWSRTIAIPQGAFSVQRMVDIDANPIIYQHNIYVATYQGKLASLEWTLGKTLWSHDISSYTGMIANQNNIYLSDANGYVWAFNANTGLVNWRQVMLEWRRITTPALMFNRYVVVADAQGYVHWLDAKDGHVVAREFAGASVYATPIVKNNILYIMTSNGYLLAYTLS